MTKTQETAKQTATRKSIVDEYGALAVELAPIKQRQARFDDLAKIIRGWYADEPGEATFVENGDAYQATLGVKQLQARVDIKGVWRALGRAKFLLVASVTQKALDEALPADVVATLVTKDRTGSRPLLVSPIKTANPQTVIVDGEPIQ